MTAGVQATALDLKITRKPGQEAKAIFLAVSLAGATYAGWHLAQDLSRVRMTAGFEYLLLAITLSIALGFEFVNGFHDTANAVATVIYTHTLEPHIAVIWSGLWNFLGVLTSTGVVAFGLVSLLPVGLILKAGKKSGSSTSRTLRGPVPKWSRWRRFLARTHSACQSAPHTCLLPE